MAKNKKILKLLAILLLVVMSVCTLTGCGKSNKKEAKSDEKAYLEPLTNYLEGIKNKDINQVLKAFPDFIDVENKITADDIEDLYKHYESLYGGNIKIEYSYGEAIQLGESEISQLEEQIREVYEKAKDAKITAGYSVPVTVTITGDGVNSEESDQEKTNTNSEQDERYVIQYNGNWYIL